MSPFLRGGEDSLIGMALSCDVFSREMLRGMLVMLAVMSPVMLSVAFWATIMVVGIRKRKRAAARICAWPAWDFLCRR